ncbi:hypothetical protein BsWGS_00755 [Bradybaena similaris]
MMLCSQLLTSGRFNEGLPSFIRGLDSEQTWQQLELRNEHRLSLTACTREVVKLSSETHQSQNTDKNLNIKQHKTTPVDLGGSDKDDSEENDESEDSEEDNAMLSSIKKRLAEKSTGEEDELDNFNDSDDQDELDFDFKLDNEMSKSVSDDENDEVNIKEVKKKSPLKLVKKRTSVVDDKFFKLSEAEQFLDSEDLKEEKRRKKEEREKDKTVEEDDDDDDDDDDEDDNEEIDMFGDVDSDDDAQGAKYTDFFDPPDDENTTEEKTKNDQNDGDDTELSSKDKNLTSDMDSSEEDDEEEEEEEMSADEKEMSDGAEEMSDGAEEISDGAEEMSDVEETESNTETRGDKNKKQKSARTAEPLKENDKKVTFFNDLLASDDETDKLLSAKPGAQKSTFELKQEKLQAKAREMEEQSLKEVSWELTGEVSSSKRPENSLLDTVLDFQHTAKAAPVITDETTKTLEDYIKQRIKDKTFDDVERKEKPKEEVFEFKKRIVLDQEKSKLSLGELYEQEFVKQQQTEAEEVKADPECEKIEKELNKLFHQLDALSNFRYTPMRPGTEVKIIVNTPAITMEEVAPVATADAELLAPEEVYEKKKGVLKAKDEMSSTDKKRALRKKKKEKRERKKAKEAREKVVTKLKPGLGNKYSKVKALKQLEQISKADKSVTLIKGEQKKMSSSTSFFTQLQEEVQTNAKLKKAVKEKKKKIVDARRIML